MLVATGSPDPKRVADLDKKIARYTDEQTDITKKATAFEAKRDDAQAAAAQSAARGTEMGLATTVFQIAIALGGITLVMKKRWLWSASLLAGLIATAQMVRVLWMM